MFEVLVAGQLNKTLIKNQKFTNDIHLIITKCNLNLYTSLGSAEVDSNRFMVWVNFKLLMNYDLIFT